LDLNANVPLRDISFLEGLWSLLSSQLPLLYDFQIKVFCFCFCFGFVHVFFVVGLFVSSMNVCYNSKIEIKYIIIEETLFVASIGIIEFHYQHIYFFVLFLE
jgi:hypothetical protein